MFSPLLRRLAVAGSCLLACAISALAAAAAGQGDLWQTTSQMSMEGMPMQMPAQTVEVCAEREWKAPPGGADAGQHCERTEFKVAGPKVTWKEHCAGPPEMTGTGEITRSGSDSYTGTIRFASAEGDMTMKLSGRRTGTCDNPQ